MGNGCGFVCWAKTGNDATSIIAWNCVSGKAPMTTARRSLIEHGSVYCHTYGELAFELDFKYWSGQGNILHTTNNFVRSIACRNNIVRSMPTHSIVLGGVALRRHGQSLRGRKLELAKKAETCAWFAVLSMTDQWPILRLSIACIGYFQKPTQLVGRLLGQKQWAYGGCMRGGSRAADETIQ
jgi:hypothetical protein